MLLLKRMIYFSKDPEGSNIFQGGGSNFYQRGWGVQMLISIETHIACDFPGKWSGPPIPLWIRTC